MGANSPVEIEIFRYVLSIAGVLVGGYVTLVLKSIGQDIKALKELMMTHVDNFQKDIHGLKKASAELYSLHRENERRIVEIGASLEALKNEHHRMHK